MTLAKPSIPKRSLDKFISELEDGSSVTEACQVVHIGRRTAYDYRSSDPDFAARWDAAIEKGTDELEKVAIKRAKEGSDSLLMFLLRGRRRSIYGEKVQVDAKVEAISSSELAAARAAAQANPEAMALLTKTIGLTD
jgi:hypothetical protein